MGRGRPYANGLLDAKRSAADAKPDFANAHKLVDDVRKIYDMKNRRTLREAPADDKERRSIEEHLKSFGQILKILKRKAEEQARKANLEAPAAQVPVAPTPSKEVDEPNRGRAVSVEVENVLSAIHAVNEAVISLRFTVLDKLVGESGAHRGKVTEMLAEFQRGRRRESRKRAVAVLKGLEQNLKVWQREAAALKTRMDSGREDFLPRDKDKLRQELIMVPNRFGIADRHFRRLINLLDVLIKKSEGE